MIAARTGLSAETAQAMTFQDMMPTARMMIARKNRHHRPLCPSDVHRKSTALPWRFRCPIHGVELHDATGATLSNMLGAVCFTELETRAAEGAAVLDGWARGVEQGALDPGEMLVFLRARRDYHEFLTTSIIRQALTVVVPEYDRLAPVLTKPVRAGLHSLVQGSLLQAFALTVGIGRIVEEPVNRAIDVLLASDVDGQGRVQDVLRSWPLSLRRQTSARFWQAQRDEREREIAEKATRQRQSHKRQTVQSHKYRYRIS